MWIFFLIMNNSKLYGVISKFINYKFFILEGFHNFGTLKPKRVTSLYALFPRTLEM